MTPKANREAQPTYVLVVEDDGHIRTLLSEALREVGLHVIEAANGDEAWSYLQSGAPVDLLFSDIHMPGSMNGAELACRVDGKHPGLHIILSSGRGEPRAVPRGIRFMAKPYTLEIAVTIVLQTLGLALPGRA